MAPQLPQVLVIEILLWLPVKSLKRFRCLSKSLCGVIDSPDFINWHLSRSSQNFNLRKMIFPDRSRKKFHVCDVNVDLEEEEEILPVGQRVSTLWRDGVTCAGNCNRLLLLYRNSESYSFGFALWNPSTRQFRDLPDCPCEIPANVDLYVMNGSGLGYDHSTDDYKAIIGVYMERDIEVEVQFWIYSLKSNIWRRAPNFPEAVFDEGIGYFTDGSLYWICTLRNGVDRRKEIVAFDVRKETFSLVPQPVVICSIDSVAIISHKLHVLEGHLCISYLYSSSKTYRADLFIRKKDAVDQFGWTNLFSVTEPLSLDIQDFHFLKVLRYSKRGDKILLDLDCMTYIYDLKEKGLRKVEIEKKNPNWNAPILYLESLVSVGGGA